MRKSTIAIIVWTALIGFLLFAGVGGAGECTGTAAYCTGWALGAGLAASFLFTIWFVGFIVLAIIWFMTRPHPSVTVYGPQGQAVLVTEREARKRIAQGWTYQPKAPAPPA